MDICASAQVNDSVFKRSLSHLHRADNNHAPPKKIPLLWPPHTSQLKQGVHCDTKITTLNRKIQLKTTKKPQFYWEFCSDSQEPWLTAPADAGCCGRCLTRAPAAAGDAQCG
jgi:hypothetical protein